jgi:hypothetical protein
MMRLVIHNKDVTGARHVTEHLTNIRLVALRSALIDAARSRPNKIRGKRNKTKTSEQNE